MHESTKDVGTVTEQRHNRSFGVRIDGGNEVEATISATTARLMFRVVPGDRVVVLLSESQNGSASIIGHHRDDLTVSDVFEIERRGTAVFFNKDPDPWWPISSPKVKILKPNGNAITANANVELARKVPPGEVMALLFPKLTVNDIPVGSLIYRVQ
ncbi:MAG: hypothetical protein H6822_00010 [Planctomycetaceae bacterium]|nr:hypothetical protein [Planctomycetaceae bacterium]